MLVIVGVPVRTAGGKIHSIWAALSFSLPLLDLKATFLLSDWILSLSSAGKRWSGVVDSLPRSAGGYIHDSFEETNESLSLFYGFRVFQLYRSLRESKT